MINPLLSISSESQVDLGSHGFIPTIFGIGPGAPETAFGSWITAILSLVMTIAGLLLLLYLIWGGVEWITSGGDKGKVESARNKITNAIIGIIVLAASVAIFVFVQNMIGIQVITFEGAESCPAGSYLHPELNCCYNGAVGDCI